MTYLPAKLGPEKVENKPKIKPNQLNSAQHHHGPSLEDNRRQPNEDELIWCGRTPTSPVWPRIWSVDAYRLAQCRYGGFA